MKKLSMYVDAATTWRFRRRQTGAKTKRSGTDESRRTVWPPACNPTTGRVTCDKMHLKCINNLSFKKMFLARARTDKTCKKAILSSLSNGHKIGISRRLESSGFPRRTSMLIVFMTSWDDTTSTFAARCNKTSPDHQFAAPAWLQTEKIFSYQS